MPRSAAEIAAAIAEREGGHGVDTPTSLEGTVASVAVADPPPAAVATQPEPETRATPVEPWPYKLITPFSAAAEGLIEYVQNPEGRFYLGIHDIDVMTRGFGRKELIYVTGRAHSGKTQVVLQAVANNPDKRILIFTPDETSELILSKLVSIVHGVDAEALEARIKAGDQEAIRLVRQTAVETFANLIVVDDSLTMGSMMQALREAEDWWGDRCDLVVVDFLELIPSDEDGADGVVAKSQAMKRFAHDADVPVICLHQASRSSGTRGQAAGMNAMRYGGETEAIFVLEVFRRKEDPDLDEWERLDHIDTVTVNVAKNKRPPCKKGEVDLFLDPQTGQVKPWAGPPPRVHQSQPEPEPEPVVHDWHRDQLTMGGEF